jgi:hypothetical protein
METHRSFTLGSTGRPLGTGRSPHPSTTSQTSELFESEVEQAVQRSGGRAAVEERLEGSVQTRRDQRAAGFQEYRDGRKVRPGKERDRGEEASPESSLSADPAPDHPPAAPPAGGEAGVNPIAPPTAPALSGDGGKGALATATASAPPAQPTPPLAMAAPTPTALAGTTTGVTPIASSGAKGSEAAASIVPAARGRGDAPAPEAKAAATRNLPPPPDTRHVEQAAEVLRQLRAQINPGRHRMLVNLTPPELGRIAIDMSLKKGRLHAVVRVESPQTLELLERQAPELRALLAQDGIETGSFEMELGFDDPSREEGPATPVFSSPEVARTNTSDSPPGDGSPPASSTLNVREGGIDTYA